MKKGKNPSGRFVLRTSSEMHQKLRLEAERAGASLNQFCVKLLQNGLHGSQPIYVQDILKIFDSRVINNQLAADYYLRSQKRLKALKTLYAEKAWADVVREAQEIVELSLKGLLRTMKMVPPQIPDVSQILLEKTDRVPSVIKSDLEELCRISHKMRRDRELAFYGSEDLTPSEFYNQSDAKVALDEATFVVRKLSLVFKD